MLIRLLINTSASLIAAVIYDFQNSFFDLYSVLYNHFYMLRILFSQFTDTHHSISLTPVVLVHKLFSMNYIYIIILANSILYVLKTTILLLPFRVTVSSVLMCFVVPFRLNLNIYNLNSFVSFLSGWSVIWQLFKHLLWEITRVRAWG